MWQGAEDNGRLAEHGVVGRDERHLVATKAHGLASLLIRRGKREREPRMLREQCAEFATGIAARTEDADGYRIHTLMHNHAFASGQCPIGTV